MRGRERLEVSAVATGDCAEILIDPPATERSAQRLFEPPAPEADGVTLEDSILGVWEDLVVSGRAECPVCGGRMRPAGPCEGCGSELG